MIGNCGRSKVGYIRGKDGRILNESLPCLSIVFITLGKILHTILAAGIIMHGRNVEEVIYVRGLDGKISDCKLAIHANCFNEIKKNMIHDLGSKHNGE